MYPKKAVRRYICTCTYIVTKETRRHYGFAIYVHALRPKGEEVDTVGILSENPSER